MKLSSSERTRRGKSIRHFDECSEKQAGMAYYFFTAADGRVTASINAARPARCCRRSLALAVSS